MQELYQTLFVGGSCSAHYLQTLYAVGRLLVCQCFKGRTRDNVHVRVLFCPDANLTCYFSGRGRGVARDNLYVYASLATCAYGTWHVLSDGVRYGHHAQVGEALDGQPSILVWCFCLLVGQYLVGKAQCAHCLILVGEKQSLYVGLHVGGWFGAVQHGHVCTMAKHYFRSTLHVQHLGASEG